MPKISGGKQICSVEIHRKPAWRLASTQVAGSRGEYLSLALKVSNLPLPVDNLEHQSDPDPKTGRLIQVSFVESNT